MLRKASYFCSIAFVYVLTAGTIGAILYLPYTAGSPVAAIRASDVPAAKNVRQPEPIATIIDGEPVRIIIPAANIDVPVDEGHYDPRTKTWTLSSVHAEFAVSTMPANDTAGMTFIYGHGTQPVFEALDTNPPPVGSTAKVYTDNGHVFTYTLAKKRNLRPTDTSILSDVTHGAPRLVVQTCSGALNEWRSEFIFSFKEVS